MESSVFPFALMLLILNSVTLTISTPILNSTTDHDALLAFKAAINYDPLGVLNWSSNMPVCNWTGVSCSLDRVTAINLAGLRLGGYLVPHLGNLTFLQSLEISTNHLTGSIPSQLSRLQHMKILDVQYNTFTSVDGSIFTNMSSLIEFYMGDNFLSGELPNGMCRNTPELRIIDLNRNQLYGRIPAGLHECRKLEELTLSLNQFSGSIPSEIGKLTMLRMLLISSNHLEGNIPSSIFNISALEYVDLSENSLNGSLPALTGGIPKEIGHLYLSGNNLTGPVPKQFGNITSLKYLILSDNRFTGSIPDFSNLINLQDLGLVENNLTGAESESPNQELGFLSSLTNCRYLQFLEISDNPLNGILPSSIGNFSTTLMSIAASNCNIKGVIPSTIVNLSNLVVLYLGGNLLTGFIPMDIGKLKQLQSIHLGNNQLKGYVPSSFWGLTHLVYLRLQSNYLSGQLSPMIGNLTALQFLDMSSNKFQGSIPSQIGNLMSITYLDLSSNQFTGEIPSSICKIVSTKILHLSNNSLEGPIPQCLGELSSLVSLNLNRNKLEGALPQSLAKCKIFQVLDIGNNRIQGSFPFWTETLSDLQVLILRGNMFKGILLFTTDTELPYPKLKVFDISNNSFTGLLPARYLMNFRAMMDVNVKERIQSSSYQVSVTLIVKGMERSMNITLKALVTIDMSSNKFSGSIPNSIGNLNSIISLNLSHNLLTGNIPASLGNISSLESLDLSSNRLAGEIPSQLTKLTFLSVLDLSMNNLSGQIPQSGGQFSTFENSSFVGNQGLCGIPLSRKCEAPSPHMLPQEGDEDSYFADGFCWQAVVSGYGSGFVLGCSMGYLIFQYGRPEWIVRWVYGIYKIRRRR